MVRDRVAFHWPVSTTGYEFADSEISGVRRRILMPKSRAATFKFRKPLEEEPGLHRTFAAATPTESGITSFADQWGMLIVGGYDAEAVAGTFELQTAWHAWEDVETWRDAVETMAALIRVWDVLRDENNGDLFSLVTVSPKRAGGRTVVTVRFANVADLQREFVYLDHELGGVGSVADVAFVHTVARQWLFELVNEQLSRQCSPEVFVSGATGQAAWQLRPNTLRTALWLLLAQEILGETKLRQCPTCARWFDLLGGSENERTSASKVFCSNACSMKAYRNRQDRARELHAEGKSLKEIAQELGVETDSIKKWVKSGRKKP